MLVSNAHGHVESCSPLTAEKKNYFFFGYAFGLFVHERFKSEKKIREIKF